MGDNVGGGAPGDGTLLAHALHAARMRAFACLYDPNSVAECDRAGVGAQLAPHLGGRHDLSLGAPLHVKVTVRSLHDGHFTEPQPRHGGQTTLDMGRTAIVETESRLTIMLTSRRLMPSSLRQLTHCGLDPASFDILLAKGVHAPVAAYAPVCKTIIRVNTPGPTCADMRSFAYHHRRRPLFPFEPIG
jgi:microcystin degradation protein MlrC